MPMCLQKPATILEIAKVLHNSGDTAEARRLPPRCAALDDPEGAPLDHVTIRAFVAAMWQAIGDDAAARRTREELLANPRVQGSLDAKKAAVNEMISLGMFEQAYAAIQTIESPADRALPLAKIAYDMLKAGRN
jgi:ATP/maltotriose-dependent transcriptional regulator MalT